MKLQFSLRTLVIVSLIAGIVVWLGVKIYLAETHLESMDRRYVVVFHLLGNELSRLQAEYRSQPGFAGIGPSRTWYCGPSQWKIEEKELVEFYLGGRSSSRVLLNLQITCSRDGLDIHPIVIEDFGGSDNDGVIKLIMQACEKENWAYELRKVAK